MYFRRPIALLGLFVAAACLAASCTRDPAVLKQRYLDEGNQYFEQKKYQEAIVKYRSALALDKKFAPARHRLAQAYDEVGDGVNAEREYVNAADVLPNDADLQVRAGLFLAAGGRLEEAKARAQKALAINPKHIEAQLLLAQSIAGLKDINGAVAEVENAIRMAPSDERSYVQLGAIRASQGSVAEAEKAFQKAVDLDPNSLYASVGFAKFYLSVGRAKDAEIWVKRAVAIAPDDFNANRTLAVLYMSTNRMAEAEAPLKVVARVSLSGTPKLVLADYYFLSHRNAEAKQVLDSFKGDQSLFSEVRTRLSTLAVAEGNTKDANRYVDEVLKVNPTDPQAGLQKAGLLYRDGQFEAARSLLKLIVTQAPRLAEAHYWLGKTARSLGDTEAARTSFLEARRLAAAPNIGPQIQLAQLSMAEGKLDAALEFLNEALAVKPNDFEARTGRVDVWTAQGKLPQALQDATALAAAYPDLLAPLMQLGRIYARQRDYAASERAFQKALQIQSSDINVIGALIEVKIAAGKVAEAKAFAEDQVAKNPKSSTLHIYASRVYTAAHEPAKAEAALREAVAADPNNIRAYTELTQLYVDAKRLDEARAQLEIIVSKQPKAVWPRNLIAMMLHAQGQKAEAKKRYEDILKIDPHAVIAANNLATLFSEDGQDPDRALDLAQVAKQGQPDSPEVNDTLGLAYYRKGLSSRAILALELSVRKDPLNPVYHYHLGLAYAQSGQKDKAREALNKSLALSPDFDGAVEAKRTLSTLGR